MVKDNELSPDVQEGSNHSVITPQEIDAIGEILNISMGSAATAISTMLDRQVVITTPQVNVRKFQMIDLSGWEPAMLVSIKYIEGIIGKTMMVFHKNDVQMIINMLMGIDAGPREDFEFDELSMSAACEVMNQMMGSSATALSSFFDKRIDISTPVADIIETEEEFRKIVGIDADDDIVSVSFRMTIQGILDTEFINIMPFELAKTLAVQALGQDSLS
ncbi:MAG: chemotaxis protein CheC, partial [Oscillospiraceae bacterium]